MFVSNGISFGQNGGGVIVTDGDSSACLFLLSFLLDFARLF